MAAGDTTILGPYGYDATSMTAAESAIATAFTSINDKVTTISTPLQWWAIHIDAV